MTIQLEIFSGKNTHLGARKKSHLLFAAFKKFVQQKYLTHPFGFIFISLSVYNIINPVTVEILE